MGSGIRILHVDDEQGFADLTETILEDEHEQFSVETAPDATAGLETLAADEFDCIVSDYDMPDSNGISFLELVREEHPALPFMLFTGKGSEEIASDAISAGVTDYLQKGGGTNQFTVLRNRITNAVERYRAEREDVFESGYTTADRGTGFGLSIVAEIAEAHGWEIEVVESGAGGTRFEITGVDVLTR